MRSWLVATPLAFLVVSGCFSSGSSPPAPAAAELTLPLKVHIVAVGFETFEEDRLRAHLRTPLEPFKLLRLWTTAKHEVEPLRYDVEYVVHRAPEAFARELFDHAKTVSTPSDAWSFLKQYDVGGPKRACTGRYVAPTRLPAPGAPPVGGEEPTCRPVAAIDAFAMERWIHDNRARHGLAFEGSGYTYFVLDSYSRGWLPKDSYHAYRIDDGTLNPEVKNLRMWGGSHDFVFQDVGVPPNAFDRRPWNNFSIEHPGGEAQWARRWDYPIWNYTEDQGNLDDFYANLARNVYDATRMLWARSPIYPFEYAPNYYLPMYVIVDPNARANPDSPLHAYDPVDVRSKTDAATIERAFQELVPWAQVKLDLKFIFLPDDDPQLAEVVRDAKNRYSERSIDFGIVKKYVRQNWARYVPTLPETRTYPTFAFWLDAPTDGGLFAYSDGDEFGNSWGVFFNAPDLALCLRPGQPACALEDRFYRDEKSWWAWWNAVLIHELGHSFGLTHPHDTAGLDPKAYATYELNWLLDSTSSVMGYRHTLPTFNAFDRDLLYRAHAAALALHVRDRSNDAEARRQADQAIARLHEGRWSEAFDAAREALRISGLPPPGDLDLGRAGTTTRWTVQLPGGHEPAGAAPAHGCVLPQLYPACYGGVPWEEGRNYASRPIEVPTGAHALLFEYREVDAPSHARWSAVAVIENPSKGEEITGMFNNGFDRVALLDLARCDGGCVLRLYVYSGANVAYDLSLTPYFRD